MKDEKAIYPINKISATQYEYERQDGVKYEITFEETQRRLFKDTCKVCARIWEVNCFPLNQDDPCKDPVSMRTLVEIIKEFLNDEHCEGVLFRTYDRDNRGNLRNYLFNKLIEKNCTEEFHNFCNDEYVIDEKHRFCVILRMNSANYYEACIDVTDRCEYCR